MRGHQGREQPRGEQCSLWLRCLDLLSGRVWGRTLTVLGPPVPTASSPLRIGAKSFPRKRGGRESLKMWRFCETGNVGHISRSSGCRREAQGPRYWSSRLHPQTLKGGHSLDEGERSGQGPCCACRGTGDPWAPDMDRRASWTAFSLRDPHAHLCSSLPSKTPSRAILTRTIFSHPGP